MKKILIFLFSLVLITTDLFASSVSRHIKFPPSDSCSGGGNYFISTAAYAICFNSNTKIPKWVSWNTTGADYGDVPRKDAFHHDDRLSVPQASNRDYSGSGYDKGHVVPSEERTSSKEANFETFSFLNMIPQKHGLNAGPWYRLEYDIKMFVTEKSGNQVFVTAGPIFGNNPRRIGDNVIVPDATWKGVVFISNGRIVGTTFVIMPQESILTQTWRMYEVKREQLESILGFKLFVGLLP